MKKIMIFVLVSLMLGSCAPLRGGLERYYRPAAARGDQLARYRLATLRVENEKDPKTGAIVTYSQKIPYYFSVYFGTIMLKNTIGPYIEVYEYDPKISPDWVLKKKVHRNGPFESIITQTDGQRQAIIFFSINDISLGYPPQFSKSLTQSYNKYLYYT